MKKFIYVFSADARDELLKKGYPLLNADDTRDVFVFVNDGTKQEFDLESNNVRYALSDTLQF